MKSILRWGFAAVLLGAALGPARADEFLTLGQLPDFIDPTYDPTLDPLHGFCYGSTPGCYDNGTVTPTNTNAPQFGFTISPGPQTGSHYFVDMLIPINEVPNPSSLSYGLTETQGGTANNLTQTVTATLVKPTGWTSGTLAGYLGLSASPSNPISAWLPYTQAHGDAGATGYYVYQADLGATTLKADSGWASGPLLTLSGPVPSASVIAGFLSPPGKDVATANSAALFVAGTAVGVPEPGALTMLGLALAALAGARWIKRPA